MMKFRITLWILILSSKSLFSQNSLNFSERPGGAITSIVNIECPEKLENRILKSRGVKIELKSFKLYLNDSLMDVKSCNTRGNNSLKFRRKSFSVSFKEPIDVSGQQLHKIAVNNLCMDKNYWRNRLCFILMKELEIFPLINHYSELKLNNKTQGTYLLLQKAEDYVKGINSPLLLRTNYEGNYEVDYARDKNTRELLKLFQSRDFLAEKREGASLYEELNKVMDMNAYFKWLSFNFLVMDGDYTDEIFFYYDINDKVFKIIPWDYDDVFSVQPHEGWQKRNTQLHRQLIFSSESSFDRHIDHDDYLYNKYLETFDEMIHALTSEKIKSAFEEVYSELYPYYSSSAIIEQSQYDLGGLTNLSKLKEDMDKTYQMLIQRESALLKIVEDEKSKLSN